MNRKMIAAVSYTKQIEDGSFKRVKEQFLIPGDTYSTAEEFVFTEIVKSMRGEVILDSLKREEVEDIFIGEIEDGEWYKCKAAFQDPESEKIKEIKKNYYVYAGSVVEATKILENELQGSMADFETKSVGVSPIVEVFG